MKSSKMDVSSGFKDFTSIKKEMHELSRLPQTLILRFGLQCQIFCHHRGNLTSQNYKF